MKNITAVIVTLCLVIMPNQQAHAQNTEGVAFCESLGNLAETLLLNQQTGISMVDSLNLCRSKDPTATTAFVDEICTNLVFSAYSLPRFSTLRMRQEQLIDFVNAVQMECLLWFREPQQQYDEATPESVYL